MDDNSTLSPSTSPNPVLLCPPPANTKSKKVTCPSVNKETITDMLGEHSGLERTVGFKSVIGMNLASMLGSCLILPGPSASVTGASAFLAVIVSGLAVMPACLSKAELSTAMPYSGGEYIYLARAFGPMLGAVTGVGLWFDLLFQAIFGLRGSTEYVRILMGNVSEAHLKIIGVCLLVVVLLLNLSGMKWVKTVTKWYTMFILFFLLSIAFAAFGSDEFETTNLKEELFTNGIVGFLQAVAFVHMGYGGLTKICALASEVKNPGFNLPWGMIISLLIMISWFSLMTFVMACTSEDMTTLGKNYHPFYDLGMVAANEVLGKFNAALCVIGMASMGNVSLLAVARFPFAMARDGLVPLHFEQVWHRTGAPWFSLVFCSIATGILIVALPIKSIVKLASSFKILMFMACNCSIMVFRYYSPDWYKPEFKSPWCPYIQVVGVLFGASLLLMMDIEGLIATLAIIFLGICLYMSYGRKHGKFMGLLKPEERLGLVPEAYQKQLQRRSHLHSVEMDYEKSSETRHSIDSINIQLHYIHDPNFLADWRSWKSEEIVFWFTHVEESRFAKYGGVLRSTIPKYVGQGSELAYVNNLVLEILGVEDQADRKSILHCLEELKLIEKPDELLGLGAVDVADLGNRSAMSTI